MCVTNDELDMAIDGRGAGAVVRTTTPEGVTPFIHGVTSSVQGVTIEQ